MTARLIVTGLGEFITGDWKSKGSMGLPHSPPPTSAMATVTAMSEDLAASEPEDMPKPIITKVTAHAAA